MTKCPPTDALSMVDKILLLENEEKLATFTFSFDAIHFWPLVRSSVLLKCYLQAEDMIFGNAPYRGNLGQGLRQEQLKALNSVELEKRFDSLSECDVLVFAPSVYRRETEEGIQNIQAKPFIDAGFETLVIEDSAEDTIGCGSEWHEIIFQHARLCVGDAIVPDTDQENITEFCEYLGEVFGHVLEQSALRSIHKKLSDIAVRLPFWKQAYQRLIAATNPELVLIDKASYGDRSFQVAWIKDTGVKVAEWQHGQIDEHVFAYMFNDSMSRSKWLPRYMPDDFLTWSEHWEKAYVGLSKTVSLGHYEHQDSIKDYSPNPKYILFIANFGKKDITLHYAKELLATFNHHHILLRLHPGMAGHGAEIQETLGDRCLLSHPGEPLMSDLEKAIVTVSEPSTIIYESIAYGIPTYLLKVSSRCTDIGVPEADTLLLEKSLPGPIKDRQHYHKKYFGEEIKSRVQTYLHQCAVQKKQS